MTPSERSTFYAPESIANAPMMRPERRMTHSTAPPGMSPVTFAARRLSGLGVPCESTLPWTYDPIGGPP